MSEARIGIDRREFLRVGGAIVGASTLPGVAAPAGASPLPSPRPPGFIIDSHNHFQPTEQWIGQMVHAYRAHGAMACSNCRIGDLAVMRRAVGEAPDVFIPFGRVSVDDVGAVREVETFHDNGFAGIKFHSPQKNWDDPSYFQVYRLCEHLGMHMLFHTGISSRGNLEEPGWGSSSRMRPMYLDTLCRQFPAASIQGAHLGNPWYEEAAEASRWNPNLVFDLTGSTLYKLIKMNRLERIGEAFWWADWGEGADNPHTLRGGPTAWEHVVFGTDEGPAGLAGNIERFQRALDANGVPEGDRAKMWGLTMARILGIDPSTRLRVSGGSR
ncbi:MAG TPA: amidohydrolase family protein [Longimicrobiaceae bacterium]